jgi:hypothetical protein
MPGTAAIGPSVCGWWTVSASKRELHTWPKSPGASGVLIAHYLECLDPCRCNSARTAAELNLLQPYSAAVTTSRFAQSALVAARFRGPVEVISPGLASAYRKPVRRRAGLRKPIIITVASVTPGKGFTEMLCALVRLAHVDWSWQIAGDVQLDGAFAQDFRAAWKARRWVAASPFEEPCGPRR